MKRFLITIFILVLVAALALGYFGFVPGVSTLMGSDKPRDLGVTYTAQDLQSGFNKLGMQVTKLTSADSPAASIVYSGSKAVNVSFTQEELTAQLNKDWKYYPVTDCQLKINSDGTVEISGKLMLDRIEGFMQAYNVDADMGQVNSYLKYVPNNPRFYVNGTLSVANGTLNVIDVTDVEIGRLNLTGQFNDNMNSIVDLVRTIIHQYPGFQVTSFNFNGGKANFVGNVANSVAYLPEP